MPPEGGLAVFRNDPLNHAREIWDERCGGCHGLAGAGGDKGPDLKGYNSRAWIRGFLENPEGPLYMGPAKLENGMKKIDMTAEERDALTEFVYMQTGALDVDQAKRRRAARSCCRRRTATAATTSTATSENTGPNLKGRGTLGWTKAVIAEPGHPLLFGEKNKMPKFKDKLTEQEIEDLARFVLLQKNL